MKTKKPKPKIVFSDLEKVLDRLKTHPFFKNVQQEAYRLSKQSSSDSDPKEQLLIEQTRSIISGVLKPMLGKAELEKVIKCLTELTFETDYHNSINSISDNRIKLEQSKNLGTISFEQYNIARNKLIERTNNYMDLLFEERQKTEEESTPVKSSFIYSKNFRIILLSTLFFLTISLIYFERIINKIDLPKADNTEEVNTAKDQPAVDKGFTENTQPIDEQYTDTAANSPPKPIKVSTVETPKASLEREKPPPPPKYDSQHYIKGFLSVCDLARIEVDGQPIELIDEHGKKMFYLKQKSSTEHELSLFVNNKLASQLAFSYTQKNLNLPVESMLSHIEKEVADELAKKGLQLHTAHRKGNEIIWLTKKDITFKAFFDFHNDRHNNINFYGELFLGSSPKIIKNDGKFRFDVLYANRTHQSGNISKEGAYKFLVGIRQKMRTIPCYSDYLHIRALKNEDLNLEGIKNEHLSINDYWVNPSPSTDKNTLKKLRLVISFKPN